MTGGGLVDGGAGADSLVFSGAVGGVNTTTMATILGGTGADTLDFNSTILNASVLGGTDGANLFSVTGAVTSSTLRGGSGNDTIDFTAAVDGVVVAGGAGADSFTFSSGATGSSISAGAGNDSVYFSGDQGIDSATYYFGKTDGKDTLSFGVLTGAATLTIAVDASYGATLVFSSVATWMQPAVLLAPSPSTTLSLELRQELCSLTTSLEPVNLQVLALPTSRS